MRRTIIAGNWKMNKTAADAKALTEKIVKACTHVVSVDVVLCPPFTSLWAISDLLRNSSVKMGAQNMHWEKSGAFTGEIAPDMIKEAGCHFVILGHSERRQYFKEDNVMVNKKVKAALGFGITPIICVGETLAERESGKWQAVVKDHVAGAYKELDAAQAGKTVIAYEPVWAIGTGKTASPAQAQEVHAFIRGLLKGLYSEDIAKSIRIQYGGSVKPDNVKDLMGQEDIDGALVGGASLEADSFMKLVKYDEQGEK